METEKTGKKPGKWQRPPGATPKSYLWACSVCRKESYWPATGKRGTAARCLYPRCPWCGADMET